MADYEVDIFPDSSVTYTSAALGSSGGEFANNTNDMEGSVEASIPAITLSASGDAYFSQSIPAITISASGSGQSVGSLERSIPAIVLTAAGTVAGYGSLDTSIPAVQLTASGSSQSLGTLEKSIPAIRLTASGVTGRVGSLDKSIPAITLSASSYVAGVGTLEASIPAITMVGRANNTIIALAMNATNFALTKYTNFGFNSFANFNGELLAAKAGGIYKMIGNTDDGALIPWKLRVGAIDTINNRITHVWLSGDISDDLTLTVETSDGSQYEYLVESISEYNDETRVKVGKGLRSRYVTLELEPKTDAVLKLAKMNVFADNLEKKR